MDAETQSYADTLHNLWEQVRTAVKDLPPTALNWTPLERDTNSIAVIVIHMCGLESMGVYQALTDVDAHRERAEEFRATVNHAAELLTVVDQAEEQGHSGLEMATIDSLGDMVTLLGREPIARRTSVVQTIRHLGEHLGHLQLTRQLWAGQD